MIATLQALILVTIPCLAIAFALLLSLVDAMDATLPSLCDATDDAPSFSFNGGCQYVAPVANKSLVRAMLALDVDSACATTAKLAKPARDERGRFIPRSVIVALDTMQARVCEQAWTAPINDRPCMLPQAPTASEMVPS